MLSPEAVAKEFSFFGKTFDFTATSTLSYEYRADNDTRDERDVDDKLHYIFHTVDFALSHDVFRLGGRLDLHLFADTFFQSSACPAGTQCRDKDIRFVDQYHLLRDGGGDPGRGGMKALWPERLYLSINRPSFDITLGDFYVSFGRGIALNVVKLDEIGQDTTIRGGKIVVRKGELNFIGLAGFFNFLDVDQATGYYAKAIFPEEPVFGARLSYNIAEKVEVGVHGVHIAHFEEDDDTDTLWGLTVDIPDLLDGDLSWGAEVDLLRTVRGGCVVRGLGENEDCSRVPGFTDKLHGLRGLAVYSTAMLSRGDWTFNLEGKYFSDFEIGIQPGAQGFGVAYHQPPTLERIYSNPTDIADSGAARLRVDYNLGEVGPLELMLYANYTFMRTYGEGLYEIHDPYGGLELQWQGGRGHWNLLSGARYERNTETGDKHRLDIHFFGDIEQPLAARHSLNLNYFVRRSQKQILGLVEWTEMDLALGYKWSPYLSLAATVEYTSDPSVVGAEGHVFFGGSLRYFFTPSTYLNVRAGENRPGLKCLNGICRRFPGFAGVQVLAVGRI